jgi:hypothetical protein
MALPLEQYDPRENDASWLTNGVDKADYEECHAVRIRDLGLEAKLIDILASPECLEIPLRCTGCPVCQEEGVPYSGSSPKIFQEHCKRKHEIDWTFSTDPVLVACSRIIEQNVTMKTMGHQYKEIRVPVPVCFHPHCTVHAQTGQSIRRHVETAHLNDPTPQMRMWDYFVSHIQLKNLGDATINDLLGEHEICVCSECGFASVVKGE